MTTNLRKRRAYCHGEPPADPVLHGLTYSSPASYDTLPLPADHRYIPPDQAPPPYMLSPAFLDPSRPDHQNYILGHAALLLNQPLDSLLNLRNQPLSYPDTPQPYHQYQHDEYPQHQHHHKRPRLEEHTIHMPTSYPLNPSPQDGQEKSPLASQPGPGMDSGRSSYGFLPEPAQASGWTGARLAECFASITMCPPFDSQPAYHPLPTPPSYDHDDRRPPTLETRMVSVQPQAQASLLPTPISPDPTALFPCDEPAIMAQYLSNTYPPLQPAQVMGFQPAISREEMVYPSFPATVSDTDYPQASSGLGIQSQPYLVVEASLEPGTGVQDGYVAACEPSAFDAQGIVMSLPPRFHSAQGFNGLARAESACVQDDTAGLDYYPAQKTTPVKRGPFKDQDSREKTALTRKLGSCIRCRMQRIRCNLDPENEKGPCLSCKKIASSTRVYRLNCLRLKITDVKLFKPGQVKGQEWTNRWKDSVMDDIGNWESSQLRTISVTEGYTGKSVRLQVRQFRPQPGDSLERKWVTKAGEPQTVVIPAFAIVNLDDAKAAFDQYIKHGLVGCCESLLHDQLLSRTYNLAIETAKDPSTPLSEKSLLISTLDLWMSVRLTTKSFEIVGDDTLDMPRDIIKDEDNPLHGKIPLPPVMGAQIDSVIIHQIQPRLRRKALEELQKMTQEKKQKTWLTTYLVTFILLHNIALITKHDANYARKHGLKRRFAREANVREYNLGANTLLAYFHYCNKATYPFSAECKDQDLQTLAELDDKAISFVHYTRRIVAEQTKEWEALWLQEDYEHEFYYVSQLFEHNWQPRTMA